MSVRTQTRAALLAVLLVVGAVAGVVGFAGSAAAAESATISTSPHSAGATATHTVVADVESNDDSSSLNEIEVDYSVSASKADVSDVDQNDVVRVGIDSDTDGEIETSVMDDLSSVDVTNNGHTLHFKFGGSYSLSQSDHVIVEYEDVQNPDSTGDYTVDVALNTQSTDNPAQATLRIGDFTAPEISNYSVTNPEHKKIRVAFDSNESLANITVTVDGAETATLTETNFTVSGDTYVATYCACDLEANADNSYTVTLEQAADDAGNDGASGQSASIEVVDPAFVDASASPSSVTEGTTVSNQEVTITWKRVSADGDSDTFFVVFADSLASSLSVNGASTNVSGGLAQSAELVDGLDGDGVTETVRFQVNSGEGGGTVALSTTVDVSVTYPSGSGGSSFAVDAVVTDSDGAKTSVASATSVSVEESSSDGSDGSGDTTAPTISGYAVTAVAGDVQVSFESSERLSTVDVEVTGDVNTSLSLSAFTETFEDGLYQYTATVSAPANATVTAELVTAADSAGNDGASGQTDSATTDSANATPNVVDASVTPSAVVAGETVNNQRVTVTWANVSADGDSDTFFVVFADALAGNVSVNSASTNVSGGLAQSAELVDGPDNDSVVETVRFQVNSGQGGGTVDLSTTVDVSVHYPAGSANTSLAVDAALHDSSGTETSADAVTSVTVEPDSQSRVEELSQGGVTTAELQTSISLWVAGDISTNGLQSLIREWVLSG